MAIDIYERLPNGTKVKVKDITEYDWTISGKIITIEKSEVDEWFNEDGWCYTYLKEKGEDCIWAIDIEYVVEETPVWVNKDTPEEFQEADMAQEIERLERVNKFLLAKCRDQRALIKALDEAYGDLGRDHVNHMLENISYVDMVSDKLDLLDCQIEQLNLQVENQIKLRDYWLNSLENLNWFQKLIIGYDTIKREYCKLRITLPKNPIIRRKSGSTKSNAGSDNTNSPEEKAKYEEGNGTGY